MKTGEIKLHLASSGRKSSYTERKTLIEDIENIIDRKADINNEWGEDLYIKNSDVIAMEIINHLVEIGLIEELT